jgi:AcrR family transcriptional regulator
VSATRVVAAEGLARATTNRIAEVAGVSTGSLYQYFPNKLAIVITLTHGAIDDPRSFPPPSWAARCRASSFAYLVGSD